jgi:hypothetical protein
VEQDPVQETEASSAPAPSSAQNTAALAPGSGEMACSLAVFVKNVVVYFQGVTFIIKTASSNLQIS